MTVSHWNCQLVLSSSVPSYSCPRIVPSFSCSPPLPFCFVVAFRWGCSCGTVAFSSPTFGHHLVPHVLYLSSCHYVISSVTFVINKMTFSTQRQLSFLVSKRVQSHNKHKGNFPATRENGLCGVAPPSSVFLFAPPSPDTLLVGRNYLLF